MGGRTSKGANQNNRQTQMQVNAPPPWAQGLYAQGAVDARELYASGRGGNVYQGKRVADLSDETNQAMSGLARTAAGFNNPNLTNRLNAPSQSAQNLASVAAGSSMGQNENFARALQNELDNSASMINARMSGAGRYGSGAHTGALATGLGNVAARATADQYNRDIDHMLAANTQIDRANQNQLGLIGDFLSRQGNAYSDALRGGQLRDNQAQDKLDSESQKWREEDNREWDRLGFLQDAARGFAGDYGTKATTGQNNTRKDPSLSQTLGSLSRLASKR